MREADVQKACPDLGAETRECATAQRETGGAVGALQQQAVAARTEWFRQMRLQSMVWGIQMATRANEIDGQVAVKNAQEIFEFLTREDVH